MDARREAGWEYDTTDLTETGAVRWRLLSLPGAVRKFDTRAAT
jgi:hypothetical protein